MLLFYATIINSYSREFIWRFSVQCYFNRLHFRAARSNNALLFDRTAQHVKGMEEWCFLRKSLVEIIFC